MSMNIAFLKNYCKQEVTFFFGLGGGGVVIDCDKAKNYLIMFLFELTFVLLFCGMIVKASMTIGCWPQSKHLKNHIFPITI